jgi:hypothetical protein
MAASPQGEQVHAEGDDEIRALNALARGLATLRGSMSLGEAGDPIIGA